MIKRFLIGIFALLPVLALASPGIMVLGDSLSASHGFDQKDGWVSLLSERLSGNGYEYRVINTSVSGETTRGALSRINKLLDRHRPAIVIIELGGNDGLQGHPVNNIYSNLERIIKLCLDNDSTVLLIGMQIPPNYGTEYTQQFAGIYKDLADRYRISLVPFLLKGFEADKALFQSDGIHPTADAQSIILDNVWKYLESMLSSSGTNKKPDD